MLKLKVTNQNIILEEVTPLGVPLVSGSAGEYECKFEFDSTWDGFTATAIFENEIHEQNDCKEKKIIRDSRLIMNNSCIIPKAVLRENSYLKIGVYGVSQDKERPTMFTPSMYVRVGASDAEAIPDPDPSIYLQIVKIMEETKAIAQGVRDDADAGKFDGGYYTIDVTQPDASHMNIAYSASKETMPEVPDDSIELPKGQDAKIVEATASVDDTVGKPNVVVTPTGTEFARGFDFAFTGLKGTQGVQGKPGLNAPQIDDTQASPDHPWSGQKIEEMLSWNE